MTTALLPPAVADRATRVWPGVLAAVVVTGLAAATLIPNGLPPLLATWPSDRPLVLSGSGIALLLALVAGCWLLVADRPRSAVGMSLVGLAWMLPAFAAWPLPDAHLRAALLAATPLAIAGCAMVVGGWRPTPTGLIARPWTTILLAAAAALAHIFGYDPFFDPSCSWTCDAAPMPLSNSLGPRQTIAITVALSIAAGISAAGICFLARGTPILVRIAGVAATVLIVAGIGAPLWQPLWQADNFTGPPYSDVLATAGTLTIVLTVLTAAIRTRIVRRNVRRVVAQLAVSALASASVSRGVEGSVSAVDFAVPDDGRWVDPAGRRAADAVERAAILFDHAGPAIRLAHGRWTDPGVVLAAITPARRLGLENARLRAAGILRLAEVRASQRRIVETTDRERRRIERDLHDGAQQRLVAVTMHLSSARNRSDATTSRALAAAETHVRRALTTLREVSHESLAAVLVAEGLAAAIEDLAAASTAWVDLDVSLADRPLSWAAQMAAYVTVAEGLDNVVKHARTGRARVTVVADGAALTVRVHDEGPGCAFIGHGLAEIADRAGALGGRLDITSSPGYGTTLVVRLPCVS